MRLLTHIAAFSLVCSAITVGCASSATDESEDNLAAQSQALAKDPIEPGEPVPKCRPACAGRRCGASDGCGKTCTVGSCPSGTVCGGGGMPNVCACQPSCAGQACGAADGCGGTCSAGTCATGSSCGISGVSGVCAPIPIGQGVECFAFNDGYTNMVGPSGAIYFSPTGQACLPDGTGTGACRRWFGRCRTTDSSHTPVTFRVGDVPWFQNFVSWSAPADAVASSHYTQGLFSPNASRVCIPDGSASGDCREYFGNAAMDGGRAVRCRLFDDGGASPTGLTSRMADTASSRVWGDGLRAATRKWFGQCEVGGCGDGVCDANESRSTCASDCTCGDGICNNGETRSSCAIDCKCGDGICNNGETASSCAADCGPRCGDGVCNGSETCSSCQGDCGVCARTTCSNAPADPTAQFFEVAFEDGASCADTVIVLANSQDEAEACVDKRGGTVISKPFSTTRVFHTDPKNGCVELELASYSDESAARCAAAKGYDYKGLCPRK